MVWRRSLRVGDRSDRRVDSPRASRYDRAVQAFAYLSVLTSIVLGLGIARLLTGLGRLLQARGRVRLYWVHMLWALNLLLFQTLTWWILFRWQSRMEWTFFLFMFLLLSPTISFLLTVLLFPDPLPDGADLRQHYFANHRWFFTLGAILPPADAVDTLLKGPEHLRAQGPLYVVFLAVVLVLMAIAACTRRAGFHAFFAVFFQVYLIVFISVNLCVLA